MPTTAFVIGGTGQIGLAVSRALLEEGYHVRVGHRRPIAAPDGLFEHVELDRDDSAALAAAARGADVIVDTVPYDETHADQLADLSAGVRAVIAISTGSVYLGRNGVSFDDVAGGSGEYPDFPLPITEMSPTISSGSGYGAAKAHMERRLLERCESEISILRPAAVHGPHSPKLREFYFIKRVLDGRRHVVLSRGGESRFSTSSTANIAALAMACLRTPGRRALNAVDDEGFSTREISDAVSSQMGASLSVYGLPGPALGDLGSTPWDGPAPFVCSMKRAREEVGYVPAVTYAQGLELDLEWLLPELAAGRSWRDLFPSVALRYGEPGWFPYDEEDRWIAEVGSH